MKYLPATFATLAAYLLTNSLNAFEPEPLPSKPLFTDELLREGIAQQKQENNSKLFDPEFTKIREKHSQKKSDPQSSAPPQKSKTEPKPSQPKASPPPPKRPQQTSPPHEISSTPPSSNQTTKKNSHTSSPRDPKAMYDPKAIADPKALTAPDHPQETQRVFIKEDLREGRFYVTAGIGGVLGTTSTKNIARVDNDAFQKASAAAYQGNSLTARFGRVDSDIALAAIIGAGYDSSIKNRSLGYSIGLEYLYQDKVLNQHYTTHDAFGNTISQGTLQVGQTHYILAKFLGKYRLDSWMPYLGIGGGMAIYNTQDKVSGGLHLPIFGDQTHAAPVIMPVVGLEYDLNQDWSITGEYKFLYSPTATFNKGVKGKFKPIETHNLIIGAKYGF